MEPDFAIFLNGAFGVGKSSTLDHIGDQLAELDQPFSLMDVDWFHRSWPPRTDDPDNVVTEAENMATVWANYLTAGPRQLVSSGVITSQEDRHRYEQALNLRIRSVRLVASPAVTEGRLRRRYRSGQHGPSTGTCRVTRRWRRGCRRRRQTKSSSTPTPSSPPTWLSVCSRTSVTGCRDRSCRQDAPKGGDGDALA